MNEARAEVKIWEADVIRSLNYEFRACRHDVSLVRITEVTGAWAGYYKLAETWTGFILVQFVYGEPPGEVRISATDVYRIEKHFEIVRSSDGV